MGVSVGGAGARELASSPAQKRAAAKAVGDHIESGTRRAGAWADGETEAAVKALGARDGDGWQTSAALRTAHETWGDQVRNLMDRLGAEKDSLSSANTVLTGTDLAVGAQLRQLSSLDRY
ncbi:hypothetical protein ACFZCP_27675 [Streptomyces sp. NPDC007971]|uniref:hypothetical protein n=1 Tax=Streptomyces sp. NPDC007971 TaxID=3364799 RepID=UPI0036E39CFB